MIVATPSLDRRYRRRLAFGCQGGVAWGELEDDPHRFSVTVRQGGGVVEAVEAQGLRTPWSTCAAAGDVLKDLQGAPLDRSPFDVLRRVNMRAQCTHMLDLAALAISAAARGLGRRVYDVEVAATRKDGRETTAGVLSRDGALLAEWRVADWVIEAPEACRRLDLRRVWPWLEANGDREDDAEALFVLRRAVLVGRVTFVDLDQLKLATELPDMAGACFTFQPGRMEQAERRLGSTLDFTSTPERLLTDSVARFRPQSP